MLMRLLICCNGVSHEQQSILIEFWMCCDLLMLSYVGVGDLFTVELTEILTDS